MKRFAVSILAAFTLGFAIAWTGKPKNTVSSEAPPMTGSRSASSRVPHSVEPRQNPMLDRVKGYLRKMDETPREDFSPNVFENMAMGDIPLLIEQWKKRAGFSGLDYDEQLQIKQLARSWYEKEPEAALSWVAGMECAKDRQKLISVMVGVEAKRNFEYALELARQYGKVELGGLDMPSEVKDKLGESDPTRFMEIMSLFPSADSGSGGSSVDFKENFDFAGLAALWDKTSAENKEQHYSFVPSNFIEEWTKTDPQAAWNWVSKESMPAMSFNGADGFFETLAKTRSTAEINTFVINEMALRTGDDSKFELAWQALASKPDAAQTADFIARLPGDRDVNLEQLAKRSSRSSGGNYDGFKEILLAQMTVEQRRQIIPKLFDEHSEDSRKFMVRALRQLGHTNAEIQVMLPRSKGE